MPTKQEILEKLSERLRARRMRHGWSQDRLAKEAGLTTIGYGDIERGKSVPRVLSLARIAAALNCSLDDLLPLDELASVAGRNGQDDEVELVELSAPTETGVG